MLSPLRPTVLSSNANATPPTPMLCPVNSLKMPEKKKEKKKVVVNVGTLQFPCFPTKHSRLAPSCRSLSRSKLSGSRKS